MAYEILSEKSYAFAIRVVRMYKALKERHMAYGLGDQVLRSGTSIGANISEAIYSSTTADNVYKFSIALKEANETRYWIKLLTDTEYITQKQSHSMLTDIEEIIKMLTSVVKTLKEKQ